MEVAEMRKARFRAVRPLVSRAPQFAGKWYSSPCALWRLPRTLSTDCRENRRLAGLTICSATYRPAETCAVPLPLIGISRRHQDLRRSCRQHYVRVEVDATHSGSRALRRHTGEQLPLDFVEDMHFGDFHNSAPRRSRF